ncbi:hypothetical protein K438DRAFT_1853603 [Mycena galopus ATCC 62051]|nr:hypothetical protein K438DRAFT_1853603 [Mycena galopus ATCC 62051]
MLLGCGLRTFSLASSILMLRWALSPASSNADCDEGEKELQPAPSPSKASPFATPSLAPEPPIHASVDGAQPEPLHRPALRIESETEPAATIQDAVPSIASAHANANMHTHLELVSILPPLQSPGEDRRAPRGRSQTEPKVIPCSTFAAPSPAAVLSSIDLPQIVPDLSLALPLSPIAPSSPSSDLVATAPVGKRARSLDSAPSTSPRSLLGLKSVIYQLLFHARLLRFSTVLNRHRLTPFWRKLSSVLLQYCRTQLRASLPDTSLLLSTATYVAYQLLFQAPQARLLIAMYVHRPPSQAPQPLRLVLANSFSGPGARAPVDTTTTAAAATQRTVLSPHRSLARVSEADVPLWLGRASGIRARSRRASRLGSSCPPESEEQTCFSDLGGWDVV